MTLAQASAPSTINSRNPNLNYEAAAIPIGWNGERKTVVVPNPWIIFSRSSRGAQEAAWEWLKFYLSEESQNIYAAECAGGYPIRNSALQTVARNTYKPNAAPFINGLNSAVTLYENATWQNWMTESRKVIQDLYQDLVKPQEACDRMQRITQNIINEG
jgi:multiple sugar transport system substrate-binding protein